MLNRNPPLLTCLRDEATVGASWGSSPTSVSQTLVTPPYSVSTVENNVAVEGSTGGRRRLVSGPLRCLLPLGLFSGLWARGRSLGGLLAVGDLEAQFVV